MNITPIDANYMQTLTRRIAAAEHRLMALENESTPTVPIYDSANFPTDAVEGQIAIAPVTSGAPGGGTITTITSSDSSITITNPSGPVVDLTGAGGVGFDKYPQDGGWLYLETTDSTAAGGSPGYGIQLYDSSALGSGGIFISSDSNDVEIYNGHGMSMRMINTELSISSTTTSRNLTMFTGKDLTVQAGGNASANHINLNTYGNLTPGTGARVELGASSSGLSPGVGIYADSSDHGAPAGAGSVNIAAVANDHGSVQIYVTDSTQSYYTLTQWTNTNPYTTEWTGPVIMSNIQPGGSFYIRSATTGPLFRVDGDGSIHGLASEGAITWDL